LPAAYVPGAENRGLKSAGGITPFPGAENVMENRPPLAKGEKSYVLLLGLDASTIVPDSSRTESLALLTNPFRDVKSKKAVAPSGAKMLTPILMPVVESIYREPLPPV
jgi:hypothetical protein